jgi:hypothetical protein
MPPHIQSRYLSVFGVRDNSGNFFMTERKRFFFDDSLPGTILHKAETTDKLWNLAYRYWGGENGIENAEHLWWVIAEFQPIPISDPTIDLESDRLLYIPSLQVVREKVLGR